MFLPWLALFDFANIRSNFKQSVDLMSIQTQSDDYALLVPIFNDIKYLGNIEFLKKHAHHVILCTTNQESPEFVTAMERVSRKYGFRVSYSPVEGKGKNPWAIYYKTLLAHDAVLKETTYKLTEKYVIFIDGDTHVDGDLTVLCGAMEENQWDIASVRVLPSQRKSIIEHLQGIEYDIAMRARLIYPWLTSGAGMVARTSVMSAIMDNHSLFFNGGDIEIGKLADMMGYKVGHIPMVFYTDIPPTFTRWVNQRRSWMCGKFRHSVINIEHNLKYPFHFIYFSFIIYILYPFKVAELLTRPHLIPVILLVYVIATYAANWKVRSKWMLVFPLYALFQIMVIMWLGIYRYATTVRQTGNFGRIRMVSNPHNISWRNPRHVRKMSVNISVIVMVVGLIVLGMLEPVQRLIFGKPYPLDQMIVDGLYQARYLTHMGISVLDEMFRRAPELTLVLESFLLGLFIIFVMGYLPQTLSRIAKIVKGSGRAAYHVLAYVVGKPSPARAAARAFARIGRAIELNPDSAPLYRRRAQFLLYLGKRKAAFTSLTRALELDASATIPKLLRQWIGHDAMTQHRKPTAVSDWLGYAEPTHRRKPAEATWSIEAITEDDPTESLHQQ
jgi:hypothetical protein